MVNEIPGGFDDVSQDSSYAPETDDIDSPLFDQFDFASLEFVEMYSDHHWHQQNEEHTCQECDAKFKSMTDLNAHELGHEFQQLFKCHIKSCECKYHKSSLLKSHLKKRHPYYYHRNLNALEE